jgi:hypothetical protein
MRGNYIVTLQSEEFRYEPARFEGSDEVKVMRRVCWMEVWSSCRDRIDASRTPHLAVMYLAISAFKIAG